MKKLFYLIFVIIFLSGNINLWATDIDVGAPCIDRTDSFSTSYTWVEKSNPSNATGTIDHIDIWFWFLGGTIDVGSFYVVSGDNLSTRDIAEGISVNSGDNDLDAPGDFTAFDINAGDYIGGNDRPIERDYSGIEGVWYVSGDKIPCTDQAFSFYSSYMISIYATGTTGAPPPAPAKVAPDILIFQEQ